MWRDPMDELIEDLERALPSESRDLLGGDTPLVVIQENAQAIIRRAEAKRRGEPVNFSEADRQREDERVRQAIRKLCGHDPEELSRSREPDAGVS